MSMPGTDCGARTQLAFAPSLRGLGDTQLECTVARYELEYVEKNFAPKSGEKVLQVRSPSIGHARPAHDGALPLLV